MPGNFKPTKAQIDALDKLLILHADHEQNASTSTVKMAGSSGANPFACIAAGVASLWGPAHGGANESAIRMLYEIKDEKNIASYIKRAKDKDDPFRLNGFWSQGLQKLRSKGFCYKKILSLFFKRA